jgi:hypothetical protein
VKGYLWAPATGEPLIIYVTAKGGVPASRVYGLTKLGLNMKVDSPGLYRVRVTGDGEAYTLLSPEARQPIAELSRLAKATLRIARMRGTGTPSALLEARMRRMLVDVLRQHLFGAPPMPFAEIL